MNYNFIYIGNNTIYLQAGYKSLKDAKVGLREIAGLYCNSKGDKGIGKVTRHNLDKSVVVEEFKYIMKCKILHISDKLSDLHQY